MKEVKFYPTRTIRNKFGITMKKCCCSCAFRDPGAEVPCLIRGRRTNGFCKRWKLSNQLKNVGNGVGRIKRREYLMFLATVNDAEQKARAEGRLEALKPEAPKGDTPEEEQEEQEAYEATVERLAGLRNDFEEYNGTVYMEF